ncbi:MAG: hypothetical protein LRY31_04045 [Burkholderiaceae bacterium]|nr:hypothetical protein [Burkholderiaceae bacterium]
MRSFSSTARTTSGGVAVDHHLDAHLEKRHRRLPVVECQKAFLAGDAGDFHDFFDQLFGGRQLELEGLGRDLDGAQKLLQGELRQHHEQAATENNQDTGRADEHAG